MRMTPNRGPSSQVEATAKQSRFHTATLDSTSSSEIDLHDVCLAVSGRELLNGARIHLQDGIKYGLTGRNGSGKSTLLHAIHDRLIPGIPNSLRIVLVSQVDDHINPASTNANEEISSKETEAGGTVLQEVLQGHLQLQVLLKEKSQLEDAIECPDPRRGSAILLEILLARAETQLDEARSVAARRSGTRGKEARAEELKAEADLKAIEKQLNAEQGHGSDDWVAKATELLVEVDLRLEMMDANAMEHKTRDILLGLGFSFAAIDAPYLSLSGGWRSRCRLALALLVESDILLMDEPSNFLDLEAIIWLQHHLSLLPQTVVLTSHDQAFLDAVCDETLALRHLSLKRFPGPPGAMLEAEEKERLGKMKQQAALYKKKEHIEASIAEGARHAKKSGDDNRLKMVKSRTKKLSERWGAETSTKGTRFKLNRDLAGYHFSNRDAIQIEEAEEEVKLRLPEAARVKVAGNLVHMEEVVLGYWPAVRSNSRVAKEAVIVVEKVTLTLGPKDRIALVGRNGKGKSTVAKAIIGELAPLSGMIERHPNLKIGYFDQHSVDWIGAELDQTPLQAFMEKFGTSLHPNLTTNPPTDMQARACLGRFGIGGKLASHTPIRVLSGGQRVRLALAMLFYDPPNCLVLDEVTTHLDSFTIRALADALQSWQGALILITHDRYFCNAVMNSPASDFTSAASKAEDTSTSSRVFLVRKAGMRLLNEGMDEYVAMIEKRMRGRKGVKVKV